MTTITISTPHLSHCKRSSQRALRHNRTDDRLVDHHENDNIDITRTQNNIEFVNVRDLDEFVYQTFKPQIDDYNESQKVKSRRITNIMDKITSDKRNPKPFHSLVIAIGSSLDMRKDTLNPTIDTEDKKGGNLDVYGKEWGVRRSTLKSVAEILPRLLREFKFYNITLHVDEDNPHLHAEYIPKVGFSWSHAKALNKICDDFDLPVRKNANGEPLTTSAFDQVFNHLIKDEVLEYYRIYKKDQSITLDKPLKKDIKRSLSMQEWRSVASSINEVTFKWYQLMLEKKAVLDEAIKKLQDLSISLSVEQEELMSDILDNLDFDVPDIDTIINELTVDADKRNETVNDIML